MQKAKNSQVYLEEDQCRNIKTSILNNMALTVVQDSHRDRHVDKWDKRERADTDLHPYTCLTYDKGAVGKG